VVSVLRDRGLTDVDARNDDGVTPQPIHRQLCQRAPNFWQGQEQELEKGKKRTTSRSPWSRCA